MIRSLLDLEMERGQKIVLTGANGIGKTTLLKSILGLIKPLSGSVTLGDYLEIGYFEQEMDQSRLFSCVMNVRILISLWAIFSPRGQRFRIALSSMFSSRVPFLRASRSWACTRLRR